MDIRNYIRDSWSRQDLLSKRQLVVWLGLLVGLILIAVQAYRGYQGEAEVINLSIAIFIINSFIFFTIAGDASRIKVAMLTSLVIVDFGCLVYYFLMLAGAGV